MKAKEILGMSPYEVIKTARGSLTEAKQIFRALKNSLDSRIRTFAKHGALDAVPDRILNIGGVRGKTETEIIQNIRDLNNFMRDPEKGTYAEWSDEMERRKAHVEDIIGNDFQFDDDEEYEDYLQFMGEMQDRYGGGEMWKGVSKEAARLYGEAKRLSIDPEQFFRNYDYWRKHVKDLASADPIQNRSGRKIYPSDYARKLGLPKISGGSRSGKRNRKR